MEMPVEPPCKTEKKGNEEKDCEGCAVLVKRRHIADLDSLGASCLHLNSVGVDDLFLSPTRVPLLQPDRVRTDADENAIVEIDAVALEVGGELLTVVSRCQTAPR